ncbi:MAG: Uncharacterised protein [Polaribacter sp. SA4-10]|nr:MAG: Uncharacterised protein [Polaribacter sp. SA4-10]
MSKSRSLAVSLIYFIHPKKVSIAYMFFVPLEANSKLMLPVPANKSIILIESK